MAELVPIEPWRDVMQVRVVAGLPAEVAGAVAHIGRNGTRWILLDPLELWTHPPFIRLDDLLAYGADLLDLDGFLSAVDLADHFSISLSAARGAFWLAAIEWWNHQITGAASVAPSR